MSTVGGKTINNDTHMKIWSSENSRAEPTCAEQSD